MAPRHPPLHHVGVPPVGVLLGLGGQDAGACGGEIESAGSGSGRAGRSYLVPTSIQVVPRLARAAGAGEVGTRPVLLARV